MLIFKKEKAVIELVLQHIDTTRNCVQATIDSLQAYIAGEFSESRASISQVNQLESEADTLLREIRDMLYSGAYLPQIRGDIYGLMSTIDDVSNKAEDCFDYFHYQTPNIPEEFKPEMAKILELTLECFLSFEKALRAYFGPKDKLDKVRKHSKRVSEMESRIDEIEREMTVRIFKSSMDKGDKLHLSGCLHVVARISDATEDAADRLEWVSVKSII
jgi:predicted phosphate transport protein (TIGR00153 family)